MPLMACSHRRQDSFVLSRPSFHEFCLVSTQFQICKIACSHRRRGRDKTVLSCPRWWCEQAIGASHAMDWRRNRILRVGKNSGPILSRLWTKVHEMLGQCSFLYFSTSLMFVYVVFRTEVFAIKSRTRRQTEQIYKFLGPNFLEGYIFLRQIVIAIYCPPFGKVWLSSVCRSLSVNPGNEVECRIFGGWVKTPVQV